MNMIKEKITEKISYEEFHELFMSNPTIREIQKLWITEIRHVDTEDEGELE